ncbi:MAG TPA: type IV pilus assembly protein PilM [Gaiellaceae bacterium]|nr:type IV pilus assembly protein PilM [Gaiellaceae bacterium]
MSESIWKKEITFRRKPKTAPEPRQAKESVWKKEISLRGAPKKAGPKQSIWKKEISLGRKRAPKPETPVLAFDLAPAAEAVWAQPPAPTPEPEPQVVEEVAAEPETVVEQPQPYAWLTEQTLTESPAVEPPRSTYAWRGADPEPEPEQPVVEAAAEEPELVAEPVPELEPQVAEDSSDAWVASPVYPELALGRVLEPEPKTSFWRKERSLKRAPKRPEVSREPEPTPAPAAKTSFLHKERSLKRAPRRPEPAVEKPKAERRLKRPSLKRAPKEPKIRNEDSFLRRERSLTKPKMSVPKRASGAAGGSGSHAVKRYVGLKVGSSQIAAARVANNGAAELLQVAREPLAHGVVVNGELRDPEALAEALKRFFARNKLPRKNVRLGIASSRIGVRVFDIAGIDDDKQLENAIRFRAQDTLPIPLDEAVLDYHILGESVDENGNAARRVLLVVAYRDLVDRYVAACRKAGVSLVGIDLEAFALLRALAAPKSADQTSDAAFVAVAIGHDRSTFAVSDGRVCEFTRVIEWGGASLSVAVARVLDMAPSEVESIKRLVSLESDTVPEGVDAADYTRAVEAVHRQVQGFARELVSSLQFYQGQPGSLGIGEIVITGGTANLAGLAGELERQIGVRVRVGDPLARLKVGKKISADEQMGSLAVAIGLGIED